MVGLRRRPPALGTTTIAAMPKILVVADEPWVVNDIHASLADASYQVTVLADPLDVADTYGDAAPDVVVIGNHDSYIILEDCRDISIF